MKSRASVVNKDKYDNKESLDYIFTDKWHKVRVDKSINLIENYKNNSSSTLKSLDIGCGNGFISERIKEMGIEAHGIDITDYSVEECDKKGIKVKLSDVHKKLPYEDKYFDIVFAGEIVEHIVDPRQFIIEVNRIMKQGGLFVITTPNLAGFDNRLRLLFGKIPRCIQPLSSHHYQHVRPFTYESLKEFLKRGGFNVESFKTNRIKTGFFDIYKGADLFPGLGATLIVGAIKNIDVENILLNKS